jgi:hypothetical protein
MHCFVDYRQTCRKNTSAKVYEFWQVTSTKTTEPSLPVEAELLVPFLKLCKTEVRYPIRR